MDWKRKEKATLSRSSTRALKNILRFDHSVLSVAFVWRNASKVFDSSGNIVFRKAICYSSFNNEEKIDSRYYLISNGFYIGTSYASFASWISSTLRVGGVLLLVLLNLLPYACVFELFRKYCTVILHQNSEEVLSCPSNNRCRFECYA